MKRIGILIGWLVWTAGVSAQSWSLDDCMKYAVEHATEVKQEVVNARQRKQDYQHAVAGFLPTVTGGVQGQYAWEGTEKVSIFKDQNGKCLRFITSPSTDRLSKAMLDRKRRVKLRFLRH